MFHPNLNVGRVIIILVVKKAKKPEKTKEEIENIKSNQNKTKP